MAIQISYLLYFLLATMVAFIIFLKHKVTCDGRNKRKLPPGDMGLPFIGENIEFFKAQRNYRLFDDFVQPRVAKYGKIFKTRLLFSPTVVVNGAEANRFFLSNEFKLVISSWPSSSVQLMGDGSIMQKRDEQHRCIRGVVASCLHNDGLEALVPKMCNSVQLHLDTHWRGQDRIGLYHTTKVLTFTIVFECLLGIKVEPGMLKTFERVLEGVFVPAIKFPASRFSRAMKARQEVEMMMVKIVREKREEMELGIKKEGMLLSQLVAEMIQGNITEKEVVDNIVLLVFAAHDTTSFAIAMTFKMLNQHPDCYSLLLREHVNIMNNKRASEILTLEDVKKTKYTWQVARESMRLFPPIFGSFRKAVADIEYEGFTIPKGWKVLWTAHGTHLNPEYFENPMSFNPSRFEEAMPPYIYLPFGGGPRLCAGYQLAKLNIVIFIHYVVTRYDWSLIYPDESITVDPLPFPSHGLPIKISPKL